MLILPVAPPPTSSADLIAERVGDQVGANVEVVHPPAQGQPVDQRDQPVREQRQRDAEGNDEAERQPDGSEGAHWISEFRRRTAQGGGTGTNHPGKSIHSTPSARGTVSERVGFDCRTISGA